MKQIIDSIYLKEGEKAEDPLAEYADLLQNALDECGVPGNLVPAWYPEGFEASEPVIRNSRRADFVDMAFQGTEDRSFFITIRRYYSGKDVELNTFEKDETPVEQYTSGDKMVYILSNNDTITTIWSDGLIVETISGNLTVEEFKKIIDSIDS